MTIEIGLLIAICTFGLSLVTSLLTQKRNTAKDSEKDGYQLGVLTQKLTDIDKKLEKIERRLDFYDSDIEKKVQEEMEKHVMIYHTNGGVK